jgi:hypothetical protein
VTTEPSLVAASDDVGSPVRALLAVAGILVLLAGVQLFIFPEQTERYFAWTIGSPMTAVFLGASYWSAIPLEWLAAGQRRWRNARIAIPAVWVFTTLTLIVTLIHIDAFHLGSEFEPATRAVTWGWIAIYTVVPIFTMVAIGNRFRELINRGSREGGSDGRTPRLSRLLRNLLVVQATVLTAVGAVLLFSPTGLGEWWPWPLTALTGRAIGAWLVGLGIGTVHARLLNHPIEVAPLAVSGVFFAVLQGVGLVRYGDELDGVDLAGVAYVLAIVAVGMISVLGLIERRRAVSRTPATSLR